MKVDKREWERMAGRVTTVANVSPTKDYPVERASNAQVPPQTRAAQAPRPTAAPVAQHPVSTMRRALEAQMQRRPPTRSRPNVIGAVPGMGGNDGPPEGVGPGKVPPGGIKVR